MALTTAIPSPPLIVKFKNFAIEQDLWFDKADVAFILELESELVKLRCEECEYEGLDDVKNLFKEAQ